MPLNEECQNALEPAKLTLITTADAKKLLPFMPRVFTEGDVATIKNESKYGRSHGMMELLNVYERQAKDLGPLKQALKCCKINPDEVFAAADSDQSQQSTLHEEFHKLQKIEEQVTSLNGLLRDQMEAVEEKLFEQNAAQCLLQNNLKKVQKESQQSLSDFEQELIEHQQKHRELNGKLKVVTRELQYEMTKLEQDQSLESNRLWKSIRETIRQYQDLQAHINQLNIQMDQSTSVFGDDIRSKRTRQDKTHTQVEKLGSDLKSQGKRQMELEDMMENVRQNLANVNKTTNEEMEQQIHTLQEEIRELRSQIEKAPESEIGRPGAIASALDNKLVEDINNVKDDVRQQAESLSSLQNQMAADVRNIVAKTSKLSFQMKSLTPIAEHTEMKANLQQLRQDTESHIRESIHDNETQMRYRTSEILSNTMKLEQMERKMQELKPRDKESAERLDNEEEKRHNELLETIRNQGSQVEQNFSEIISNARQMEQIKQDFDDLQSQYMRKREPFHSSILLIGGQIYINKEYVQSESFEIYCPPNSCLNRILDCKLKVARGGHISQLLSDKQLYVVGGWNKEIPLNSVEIMDPFLQIHISDGPSMSVNRSAASAVIFHDRLLVFGGLEEKPSSSSEVYNPHTSQWSPFINMQHTRWDHCAVELDGKVYLIGGRVDGYDISHISPSVSILDIVSHTWSEKEMKERRSSPAAAIIDGRIVVTGGYNSSSHLRSCIQYDPREGEWREIGDMKEERESHTIVNFNGKLIVMGGYDGTKYLDTVEEYDSRMDTWHTLETTLKEPKEGLSAVVL